MATLRDEVTNAIRITGKGYRSAHLASQAQTDAVMRVLTRYLQNRVSDLQHFTELLERNQAGYDATHPPSRDVWERHLSNLGQLLTQMQNALPDAAGGGTSDGVGQASPAATDE
jgi:hypothetical protein